MRVKLPAKDAVAILKKDHDHLKKIFKEYGTTKTDLGKEAIALNAFEALKLHMTIEEEIFYPAAKLAIQQDGKELVNQALEEHHMAKLIIAELKKLEAGDGPYDAKFKLLVENVAQHMKEEEKNLFSKVKASHSIDLDKLGEQIDQRKNQLKPPENKNASVTLAESKMSGEGEANYAQAKTKEGIRSKL